MIVSASGTFNEWCNISKTKQGANNDFIINWGKGFSGIKVNKTQFHPVVIQDVSNKPLKCCSSIAIVSSLSKDISIIYKSSYFAKPWGSSDAIDLDKFQKTARLEGLKVAPVVQEKTTTKVIDCFDKINLNLYLSEIILQQKVYASRNS